MRFLLLAGFITSLIGCSSSQELQQSETLLNQFECQGIDSQHMSHSSITDYHQHALYQAKHKAENYIRDYKEGTENSDLPLPELMQQQFEIYQDACENLGGILP